MGGKTMGIIGIVLGAILIVTGIGAAAGVMLIASGIMSLVFQPKTPDQEAAVAQELSVSPASVGNPVPVVFGMVRITPNFINYSLDHFEAVEVFNEPQGGKGGADQPPQSMGFDYYLKWEYGLCMGPIDYVGQVYAMPGEVGMHSGGWTIFSGDYVDLTLEAESHGGAIRVYKGAADQTRVSSGDVYQPDGMNYRNVAWVLMGVGASTAQGFKMGQTPQPQTYQFMVRRLPKCLRDNGSSTSIVTRGSLSPSDFQYWEANPAAIIYEILTNKVWGRGLSSDIIDEASFVACAEYFATNKIGMSFKIDSQEDIGNTLEGIRRHVKTILTWDGETYKLRCLLDPDQTHEFIQTLKSDEISDLTITRPLWDAMTNEVRSEFTSKDRSYRQETAHAQNVAAFDIMDAWTVTERLNLGGFSDQEVIGKQLNRILQEMSYPYATATWEMNRYKSQIEIGDVVRIVWDEFDDNTVTSYWLILQIEDGASDDENIKITALEDMLLAPVSGEELTVTLPTNYAWEFMNIAGGSDTNLHTPPTAVTEEITPIIAFEYPPLVTGGEQCVTLITGEKTNTQMVGSQGMWSTDGSSFTIFGVSTTFAVTGNLDDAIVDRTYFDRSAGYQVTITDSGKKAKLLAANLVQEDTDDLETLAATFLHYVLIDNEIMQVGYFEDGGGDLVIMRNILRGLFGSRIESHAAGSKIFYLGTKAAGFPSNDLPEDTALYFKGYPMGLWNTLFANGSNFQTPDTTYYGRGRRPQQLELVTSSTAGSDVTVKVRPRWSHKGAGVGEFYQVMRTPISVNDEGITIGYKEIDATGAELASWIKIAPSVSWVGDVLDGSDPEASGILSSTITVDASTKVLRLYAMRNGRSSPEYVEVIV